MFSTVILREHVEHAAAFHLQTTILWDNENKFEVLKTKWFWNILKITKAPLSRSQTENYAAKTEFMTEV